MIKIKDSSLASAAEKGMDEFLKVFTDAYLEAVGGNLTASTMNKLNGSQHALLAYRFLTEELNQGGFVQLIQNGYGGYIFWKSYRQSTENIRSIRNGTNYL